ncbi:YaiO family outer membrane beta-barrel protein [Draconibacterium halophilum]|uniref:YaiO family outer membrane beta-barrel protein n=1 Tax=Draconibacterium halophilum TaxID=2706887 RepID=A0A6C0RE62_9BACT|nr:YaiO family outer membrane beta-barrel protein [Draconibacterium halophilum]QIA08650.1 YaiO family outer membrane beta-barrel protein [Draconibacterium halophilum]
MKKNRLYIQIVSVLFILLVTGTSGILQAQTFDEARNYAFNGEREKARSICRQILSESFNSDVALLMGRTYAWDGMYDSARVVLQDVLIQRPENMEAYDALSDVEFWADNNAKAIEYCNAALKLEPESPKFTLKKARILYSNEQYEEAVNVLENYLHENPGEPEFLLKLKDYRLDLMKNKIRLVYTYDHFNSDFNRDPWHFLALSYGRKTKLGSVIARLNYANRFDSNGLQLEMDAYPKISENNYAYVNYGFSSYSLFPGNRFGFELYHNFPKAWEGSLGMRYLDFSSSGVDIYTATLGKYVGNYWISLRSYVTPDSDGTSVSGALSVRRYFADAENYLGLKLSYGVSPDDNRRPIDTEKNLTLKTRSARVEYNRLIKKLWIVSAGFNIGSEQLEPGNYSGYYSFDIGFSRLF